VRRPASRLDLGVDRPGAISSRGSSSGGRGFIKAEVVSFDNLIAAGPVPAARAVGKARIEGKDYVMHDGDVVEFRLKCLACRCPPRARKPP
jgi:Protein of unknown function (DUF933)